MSVATLTPAVAPHKEDTLALLDRLRGEIEAGEVLALVTVSVLPENGFRVSVRGNVKALDAIGMLACAQADLIASTKR